LSCPHQQLIDTHVLQSATSTSLAHKPTESLKRVRIDELSELGIFLLVNESFTLKDVRTMVSLSELYSSARIVERIVGNQYP
jgi:tRNA U38,U39,U40 pseudouridine synthase TruA